ncbi:MAG: porin [Pirellulales bacterium]
MKRLLTRCAALGAGLMWTSLALAAQPQFEPPQGAAPASRGTMASYFEEADAKNDEAKQDEAAPAAPAPAAEEAKSEKSDNCGCANEESSCCDAAPTCGDSCADPSCGCPGCLGCECKLCIDDCWPFTCCCKPGDPWTLQSCLGTPCCCCAEGMTYGGWLSMGFYTNNDPLSFHDNDLLSFWDNPGDLNFDQEWFWIEKKPKTDSCSWDWGYRADLVYGVDAQKTQAFGNSGFPNPQGYDNGWDNGRYGWALPQLYADFAKGDLDIKVGHFFTLVGYEVIPKTGNFFYSHSYTMFNSEPFTHTGVLATYKINDELSVMGGWVLGWDTGYDQFRDGNAIHSGFIYQLDKNIKYSYMMTAGDLGWRGDGYSHSNVVDFTLSKKWEYVFQSDLLTTDTNTNALNDALSYGANNYLFYTINDCWKWGTRMEWWRSNQVTNDMTSFYELTTGLNYKYSANLVVRPEVKYNWCPGEAQVENTAGGDFSHVIFGMDAIYTF